MELQDLDKLIIEMGMLGDKCIEWRKKLEEIKDAGEINRYDIDIIVLMGEMLKLDANLFSHTVGTATSNFMNNLKGKS